tara:strand:+ start:243 stop:1049 length:807 start_codon:yes stop_codon:yes gene_type:complete
MSNFTDFIGGGGGSASFPTIFLHNSQTWVPPQDGNIMIHVIGAGGSGCVATNSNAESGAAGGYCRKNSLAVTTSGSFTVTIGAGGASRIGSAGAGTAGGNTTVAGTGLGSTLTANGGAAGNNSNNTYTAGGTALNGDVNYAGGRGGTQKGGGAVGLTGAGNDGGNLGNYAASFGGNCDILGDFYSSSLGQLSGSSGSIGAHLVVSGANAGDFLAGPLGGAGGTYQLSQNASTNSASVGGGGGYKIHGSTYYMNSGRGGEGCVVIQYIP